MVHGPNPDRVVTRASLEAQTQECFMKLVVPLPRALLQTIKGLLEVTNHMLLSWLHKSFWLNHIYIFFQITIKKGRGDIHVVHF
jgi:hypothetical protein